MEAEIKAEIKRRYPDWERWGLAPADMLMAAAGPAMEVVGRYSEVLDAKGEPVDIHTFLPLARAAVQEAMAVEIDHHPLETFDARTRFALWWVRLYGRQVQAKSELRWQALASSMDSRRSATWCPTQARASRFTTARGVQGAHHGRVGGHRRRARSRSRLRGGASRDGRGTRGVGARRGRHVSMGGRASSSPTGCRTPTRTRSPSPACCARARASPTPPRARPPQRSTKNEQRLAEDRTDEAAVTSTVAPPTSNASAGGKDDVATNVTPWWKALKIRQEILSASGQIDDVQMSLFQAVHGLGADRPLYADAGYYGEITHPTERLADLLTEIAVRIGGGAGLPQGPRRSPGSTRAWAAASRTPASALSTWPRIPKRCSAPSSGSGIANRAKAKVGHDLPADLNRPHVVVLPCDNMTPGAPVQGTRRPCGQPLRTVPVAAVLQGLRALRALPAVLQRQEQDRRGDKGDQPARTRSSSTRFSTTSATASTARTSPS